MRPGWFYPSRDHPGPRDVLSSRPNPIRRSSMLLVGTSAPPFNAKAHTGEDVSLSDYAGKLVVLWFYPKADTPG